ncbi:MAG TPA: hypothetical protein VFB99_06890 [Vicinamibacterales bacterium]|jgi:hypothetical protein|nr:hypothetical protein [Vicinamibacterales bacterium]
MKEAYWDRSGLRWLEDAQRDIHHALRTLRRRSVVRSWSVVSASRSSVWLETGSTCLFGTHLAE